MVVITMYSKTYEIKGDNKIGGEGMVVNHLAEMKVSKKNEKMKNWKKNED